MLFNFAQRFVQQKIFKILVKKPCN